ncbi:hypothetical protein CRH09_14290 [Nocardia terpenica]|uniref:MarR family transcriptional regulator n=1 Tax=Nocardia terpenica TaxID=455432 RepID=A0A291RJE0_9NOCA|nr:hypothetical protein CRH09_14290 [Nocardia terpenica]
MKQRGIADSAAEMAVLTILAPGGLLTCDQLAAQTHQTTRSTRGAVLRLQGRGLIMPTYNRARWQITDRGRAVQATKGRRFAWL